MMGELKLATPFLCLALSVAAQSLHMDLQSGNTRCVSEDIEPNAMSVGHYTVVNPNEGYPMPDTHRITVRVVSPHGNSYHDGENVQAGEFAFTAAEGGDHMTCFWVPDHTPEISLTVDFDWKTGIAAKDWPNVAKKGQIESMELELKKLYLTVSSIHDEMFNLRVREEEMRLLNRATNTKMATFSFFSLVVCLSVAGLQLWHLKTFFERKKLL